jgi:putative ATPase
LVADLQVKRIVQLVYQPTPRGLEGKIGEKLARLAELDAQWREEHKDEIRQDEIRERKRRS